jgi:GMP synthase-like glutamine amidotransferase
MRALFLQYEGSDTPGLLGEELEQLGIEVDVVHLDVGHEPIDVERFDIVVGLGGAMNADQVDEYPYLIEAREVLRTAVEREITTLGICLSAQVLARAFDAPVVRMLRPEIGLIPIDVREPDDPLLAGLGERFVSVQFHEDSFALPAGARLLAVSEACPNQVARLRPRAWAVQFHPEVSPATFAAWIESDFAAWSGRPQEDGLALIDEVRDQSEALRQMVATLVRNLVTIATSAVLETRGSRGNRLNQREAVHPGG